MSESVFIYPQHPIFEPYRELAETTELAVAIDVDNGIGEPTFHGDRVEVRYPECDVSYDLAYGWQGWSLANAPDWSLDSEEIRRSFWRDSGGINTLSFYKKFPGLYINEGLRAQRWYCDGRVPQANEIIAHGVGVLRPRRAELRGFAKIVEGKPFAKRIESKGILCLGTYIVDVDDSRGGEWVSAPCAYESTNLVMPEVLGELRQLQERRDETDFINAYFRDLLETFRPTDVPSYQSDFTSETAPACIAGIKKAWRIAHQNHLQTGLWQNLPCDEVELLDRVDELVDRIVVDVDPVERIFPA